MTVANVWFPISPALVLGVLVALTGCALLADRFSRRGRRRALRRLAGERGMNYSADDRLRVASKIAGRFPVAGAADLYITDLLYGVEGGDYRYLFTVEYTVGAVRPKHREIRVATFCEPRDRQCPFSPGPVTLAPEGLDLLEQYRRIGDNARQSDSR